MAEREQVLRELTDRGETASLVLKELEKAKEALEKQVFDSFRASDVHDARGHQAQRFYLKVLDDTFSRFEHFVLHGEEARKELVRIKKPTLMQRVNNG